MVINSRALLSIVAELSPEIRFIICLAYSRIICTSNPQVGVVDFVGAKVEDDGFHEAEIKLIARSDDSPSVAPFSVKLTRPLGTRSASLCHKKLLGTNTKESSLDNHHPQV